MRRLARAMLVLGTLAIVPLMGKLHASVIAEIPYSYRDGGRTAWTAAYLAILLVSAYGVGLPDLPRTFRSALLTSLAGPAVAAVGISIVQLAVGDALLPRFVVFGSALLLVPWYLLCVFVSARGRTREGERDRVAVIGSPEDVALLQGDLDRPARKLAQVVRAIDVEEAEVLGATPGEMIAELERSGATVVVLDRAAQGSDRIVDAVAQLHEQGIRVRTMSLFYEEWLGKLPIGELERVSLMFDIGEVHRARYGRISRILDIVVASLGLVALVVCLPFVLVGDLLANRGPLLYRQERVGKGGVVFRILKFRTMVPDADALAGGAWTSEDDPRITRFGGLLRRTHLDELPQVVNILRGELAVVGPRPEQPRYVAELTEKLPYYELRHLVRPGLTGWAQVHYDYGADLADALEKLQYEFYYLRHQSLALDLLIIAKTVRSVVGRRGR